MLRKVVLAALAAGGLAAPVAATAQDWDHDRGGYEQWRGDDHDGWRGDQWREHEWREHQGYGGYGYGDGGYPVYRGYSGYGYAPYRVYHRQHCWRETRRLGWGRYEVITRCRR